MKHNDHRIEELLHKYEFDKLSNTDKDYVLSEMSAQEYNHLYKIVQVTKYEYNNAEIKLPQNIKTSLKKKLVNKWHRPRTLVAMLAPILWIGLGAMFMHFIWKPISGNSTQEPISIPTTPSIDTVYIELRDTIIKEIEAPPVVQIKEVIKYRQAKKGKSIEPIDTLSMYANTFPNELSTKISLNKASKYKTGESISNEEELMDLLTPILTDRLNKKR